MNPATNQYPRPNLTLLRKRFKQRDERQIINTQVSAKKLGYGHLKALALEAWGEATTPSVDYPASHSDLTVGYRPRKLGWSHVESCHPENTLEFTPQKSENPHRKIYIFPPVGGSAHSRLIDAGNVAGHYITWIMGGQRTGVRDR